MASKKRVPLPPFVERDVVEVDGEPGRARDGELSTSLEAQEQAHAMTTKNRIFEYGVTLRPVSFATVPAGFVGQREHPRFNFGVVQYDRPLSRSDIEHYDLVPLDPLDPLNLKRRMELFKTEMMDEFSDKDIYVVEGAYDRTNVKAALTYSLDPKYEFRITTFEGDVPTGHVEYTDFDEAVHGMFGALPTGQRAEYGERAIRYQKNPGTKKLKNRLMR